MTEKITVAEIERRADESEREFNGFGALVCTVALFIMLGVWATKSFVEHRDFKAVFGMSIPLSENGHKIASTAVIKVLCAEHAKLRKDWEKSVAAATSATAELDLLENNPLPTAEMVTRELELKRTITEINGQVAKIESRRNFLGGTANDAGFATESELADMGDPYSQSWDHEYYARYVLGVSSSH